MKNWRNQCFLLKEGFCELVFPSNIYCICCGNLIDDSRPYSLCDDCVRDIHWANGKTCQQCGKPLGDKYKDSVCNDCIEYPRVFDKGFCCVSYETKERELLHRFKYKEQAYLGRKMAQLMCDRILPENLSLDVIVPVPMFEKKKRIRGYNQAEVLSRFLANYLGLDWNGKCLIRTIDTGAMSRLGAEERRRNVHGVFTLSPKSADIIRGKNILLVDDIYTTGSTMDACSEVLNTAGAKSVYIFAFAAGANA